MTPRLPLHDGSLITSMIDSKPPEMPAQSQPTLPDEKSVHVLYQ